MLIIFDLDDTLVDTSAFITPAKLEKALASMMRAGCALENKEKSLSLLLDLNANSLSSKEALKKFISIQGVPENFYSIGIQEVYDSFPHESTVRPIEGAIETLSTLYKENYLTLVSVGKEAQQLFKLEKAGIDSSFFYKIFISEERNKKKYYQLLMEELKLSAEEVIVCGDRVEVDLTPAKEMGCTTVHMRRGRGTCEQEGVRVDFSITQPIQLLDIVKQVKKLIF